MQCAGWLLSTRPTWTPALPSMPAAIGRWRRGRPERVKQFDLTASVVRWNILPKVTVLAYGFNNQIPGPRLQLTLGDKVRIKVTNDLPEPTTVHWHGLDVPNTMDGPAEITQDSILIGRSFTYRFTVERTGTFYYHSHTDADRQQALGLSGAEPAAI